MPDQQLLLQGMLTEIPQARGLTILKESQSIHMEMSMLLIQAILSSGRLTPWVRLHDFRTVAKVESNIFLPQVLFQHWLVRMDQAEQLMDLGPTLDSQYQMAWWWVQTFKCMLLPPALFAKS